MTTIHVAPRRSTRTPMAYARRLSCLLFAGLALLAAPPARAQTAEVSLMFTEGFIGTMGSSTNKANNISTFATLGVARAGFFQSDADGDGLFGGTQGNDLGGTVRLYLTNGTIISFAGALNWRITSSGGGLEALGFIIDAGQTATIPYGSGQTYSITGGTTSNSSSTIAFRSYTATTTFVNGTNESGNAATSGLLTALNSALTSSPNPSTITVSGASITEGQSLAYTCTLSATTTYPRVFAYSVSGTVTAGTDYSTTYSLSNGVTNNGDGTITVPTSVTSFTFTVNTTNDTVPESDETMTLSIATKSATVTVVDNDAAPNTTIGTKPASLSNSATGSFTFTSDVSPVTFECSIDGGAYAACNASHTTASLADGSHTLSVRAVDSNGYADPTPATYTWTIDTTPPNTTITSSPSSPTNGTSASLAFTTDNGTSFECAIDGGSYAACTSPKSYTGLAEGAHTFTVRAIDAAGNVDATPASATWTIDTTAPDTTITSAPSSPTSGTSASLSFTTDNGTSFECAIDAGAYAACTSPKSYTGLAEGSHTFTVRAIDAAGNVDASPASATWTIDTTAPNTTITSSPSSPTNSTSASIAFTTDNGTSFECAIDGGSYAACTSPKSYTGLAEGPHTFTVRAIDAAGNVDATPASATWTIDTTAPNTTITSSPSSPTNSTSASLSFTTDNGTSFECAIDGGSYAACTSPKSYTGLAEGPHTFAVRAIDAAGNVDATPASATWTVDLTSPDTTITSSPASPTNATTASLAFATDNGTSFECALDGGAYAACTSPKAYTGLAEGAHTFTVRAIDAAGNVDASPASATWTIDTTAPSTTIDVGPAARVNVSSSQFEFSSNSPGTFECRVDFGAWAPCATASTFGPFADGTHDFEVRAIDTAGNVDPTPAAWTWIIDTGAPDTFIDTGPGALVKDATSPFTFSASETSTYECRVDGGAWASCTSPYTSPSLADGAHTLEVRATDLAGNTDPTPALWSWTIDLTPPDTTITAQPASPVNVDTASFSFTTDTGTTFECKLDGGSYGACTSPKSYTGLSGGSHTFYVRAIDAAGNVDATPASATWTIVLTTPETTITAAPASPVNVTTASFSFTTDSGTHFECALDGGAYAACSSPKAYTGLAEGAHTFAVRSIDAASNIDPTPATHTWTIDLTPPDTTITAKPAALVNVTGAAFSFTTDSGVSFECKLDAGSFAPCTSPASYTALAEGSHTFEVRATDAAGNTDATPASWTWSIDTTAPDTTITAKPASLVNATGASFSFTTDTGSTFECAIDGGAFGSCSSPKAYTGLPEGAHAFSVRAIDAAGNVDATPASWNWTIDLTPPDTTITASPASLVNTAAASFAFTTDTGVSFECALDGAAYVACASPQAYTGLAEGAHTFAVRATDAAGNTDPTPASYSWTIDLTPPDTTITASPSALVNTGAASFSFTTDTGTSFECKLDGGAYAPCTSPKGYSGLAEGAHTFLVRATDAAGNTDPTPAGFTWTIDLTPPDTTITSGPTSPTNATGAAFSFTTDTGTSFECALDGGAYAACATGKSYAGLAEGAHTVSVRAVDAAGNVDPSPAAYAWTIDLTPPDTTITAKPASLVNVAGASFSFTTDTGTTFECKLDAGSFAACATGQGYTGLAEGAHTFAVRALDAAGNVDPTPATWTWTIDLTPPDTTITAKPASLVNTTAASFSFTTDTGATFECSLDGAAYAACTTPAPYTGLAEGSHTFAVRAIDAAGNTDPTPESYSWDIDTTPPDTTITAKPAALVNTAAASFSFTTDTGTSFACSLDGAAYATCTSPTPYTGLAEGSHTFEVRATDAAGNTDPTPASWTWEVDLTPPNTTITDKPASLVNVTGASFSFTTDTGTTFACSLDGAAYAACSSPKAYTGLAEGSHTFAVRATDAAGNTDPTPAAWSWTIDLTAPETTITAKPAGLVNVTSASFAFATDTGTSFACALDGAAFTACTSPKAYTGLAEGQHTFEVRATDAAGNTDPTPASWTWEIDLTPPDTTITAQPAALVNVATASFTFATDTGTLFECSLDGAAYAACTTPKAYAGLAEGRHTFEVRAIDAAGNVDPTPADYDWEIDLTPPDTTITQKPASLVNTAAASFAFTTDTGTSFRCSLDGAAFTPCTSPKGYTGLAEGSHTFAVEAIDAAGNADPSPAEHTWEIDLTPPDTTITQKPATLVNTAAASFAFTTDTGTSFRCSLDGSAFAACTSPKAYASLAEGTHTFAVVAIDAAGNVDPTPASYSWDIDLTAPDTTITAKPAALVNTGAASFSFTTDTGTSFECALDGAAFAPCTSPTPYTGLAEGSHAFAVRAIDAAGNVDPTPASWSWVIDLTPPDTTITQKPASLVNTAAASFSFTTDTGTSFRCSLDGVAFTACTSPKGYTGLAEGAHTFAVEAIDAAGNVDPTPESYAWNIDLTPPDTTITSRPAAMEASDAASFAFTTDTGTSFRCSLDGSAFAACTSPKAYAGLSEGAHTFAVEAVDAAGNVDPTPATYTWTIDLTTPDTTITQKPPALVNVTGAAFAFTTDSGTAFRCRLDGAAFAPCTSPKSYAALAEGTHTFEVQAFDGAGNTDPTPATWTWEIDLTPPDTTITDKPASLVNTTAATLSFATDTGATFLCSLDGAAFATCTDPAAYQGLAEGTHAFAVKAVDAAGNVDPTPASYSWVIDLTAPDTTIVQKPATLERVAAARFTFASDTGTSYLCSLDGSAFAACAAPQDYAGLADGAHTFDVKAVDAAGNVDPTPASYRWSIDTQPPATTIDRGPAALVAVATSTFDFSSNEAGTFECRVDFGAWAPCTPGDAFGPLADGTHDLEVRAIDAAGNVDPTPAAWTWVIDTTPPDTFVDAGPGALVAVASSPFTFSATESPATYECRVDAEPFAACTLPYASPALADGAHTFEVRATDAAGNTDRTPALWSWTIDTTPPDTTITASPAALVNTAAASFAFTTDTGTTFLCSLDRAPFAPCTSPSAYTGLAEGTHHFDVKAVDAAGNVDPTPASYRWSIDLTPPDTTIVGQPAALVNVAAATFDFTTDTGSSFECALDGAAYAPCTTPKAYADLAEGAHTFDLRAIDAAGNTDPTPARWAWTIDLTPPDTTITDKPAALVNLASASFSFTTDTGATFECALDGAAYAVCTSPLAYTDLAEGAHTFDVRAIDAAGNVDPTPARWSWTIDLTPPDTTLTDKPAALVNVTSASFSFTTDTGVAFLCSLDGAAFAPCTSPAAYTSLAEGAHAFEVKAVDAAGNVDPTPARWAWTVDVTPPETTITDKPLALVNVTTASFAFTTDTGVAFECSLDGAGFAPCTTPHALTGLAEGAHAFAVRAVDAAGNADPIPESYTWNIDLTPPDTTITDKPAALVNVTSATLAFTTDTGASFECALDGAAYTACASSLAYTDLAEGAHTFDVRAIDAAGNVDPTPARWSWTIDVTPPGTTITAKPAALVNVTSASFSFTTDTGVSFLCSLDGAAFAPCTSPAAYASLSEGAHTFEVKAVDAAGNVDPTPAAWAWTIDVTPPETTITQGPAANEAVAEAALSFTTDTGVSFLCSLDGAAFAACTSPQPYAGLDEGPHAFAVKAVDAAGNVDPTPATWAWTIDLTTPETTLTQKPAAYERVASAAFAFATDSGTSYRCRLDGAAFAACTTPVTFAALAEGEHAFEVFAVDDAGNADPTPARWGWTVDLTPPDTTLTEKPAAITNATGATLAFTTDTGAEFRCSLDGAPAAACTSPFAATGLAEGPHTFEVYAIDLAGNVDPTPARHEWVVDVTPPDTTITAKPAPAVAVADATFAFTTDTGTTFACSLDGGAYAPCVSPAAYAGLAEGAHTFAVRATDAAGNTDPTPDSYGWNIDLTAPETTIEQGPPAQSASATGAFEFASTEPGTYECSLDGAAFAPCEESHTTAALEDGPHTLEVRAIDLVGNVDPTPARHEWTVDTGLPDTTIATAPAAFSASAVAAFTFTASEEATYECSLDGAEFVSCDAASTFGPLGDGPHVLLVRAIDRAGNVDATPASHEWVVDTTAPETFVDAGPSSPWGSAQAPFTFSASEPVTYECSLDGAAFAPCDAATAFGPLADGPHELLVRATDRAGNVDPTPAAWRWTSDTTPPDTTITAGPAATTRETSAAFAFASTEPGRYECSLDGAAFAPCEAATSLEALAEGAHTLAVRAIDETGNVDPTPATWAWTVDVTAPETTLTAKPAALVNVATARLEFTSDDGVAYLCSVDGAAFAPCASPLDLTGLSEGRHTFAVKAVDAVGNEDATPATWAWEIDLTAPETRISTGPASPTFERSAAFTLESENGATYECSLDGAAFAPCDATFTRTALTPGEHVLEARAVDAAGNVDPTPAAWRWRIKPGTDRDGDGLNEEEEAALGTSPDDGDSDDDGVLDGDEPDAANDTDGDGLVNALDPDSDDDGLFDGTELGVSEASTWTDVSKKHFTADADPATRTDPLLRDTDGGGLSDGAEDFNADGKLDASEGNVQAGEDDGALADTDGDGMPDAKEALLGSNPNDRDTDDDGVIDGREPNPGCDDDLDGLVDVLDPDSDGDFLWDGTEMAVTAPDADTDVTKGHYLADADPATRTSPVVADTDRGGVIDGWEDFDADGKVDTGEFDPLVGADDAIDDDADKDGIVNAREAPGDKDGDGTPDALDTDSDDDGLPDSEESGLTSKTAPLRDTDGDGLPDFRDTDSDNDGIADALDNCPIVVNAGQEDTNGAAPGDACTDDRDGDGVLDVADNCPDFANAEQTDTEGDGLGDACDAPLDEDKDGVIDGFGVTGGGCLNSSPGAVTWLGLAGLALLRRRRR